MKVLNSSTVQKNLKVGTLQVSFPPGVSEQPELTQVVGYVSHHAHLSIFTEPEAPGPKKKTKKKTVKKKEETKQENSKKKSTEETSLNEE